MVRIGSFDSREAGHRLRHSVPITTATGVTRRFFNLFKPGFPFKVHGVDLFCRATTVDVNAYVQIIGDNDILVAGALGIDSAPEKFLLAASRYILGGLVVEKTAATALTFTAAHVVTASKSGCILVQVDNAGTISTLVGETTQTTAMAYATAGEAALHLPSAAAGKLAIGYITINNNTGTWTAGTDDMTNASDVTTATFTTYAAVAEALASSPIFAANKIVSVAEATAVTAHRDITGDKMIALSYTSDGDGAVTEGVCSVIYRAIPMYRDPSLGLG